ncbi:MAG TPA: PEGA domain-containing protein, partial [Minicystis sp.]|nr:PEGA domain-containing protein [Minicystis sp.]
ADALDDAAGSNRSSQFARTQRLPRPDDTDERPRVQPPRLVPSVIVQQPRRPHRASSPFAGRTGALLGAASLLLSIALGVWLLRPHKGELRIAVFAPRGAVDRAEIFVDGEKKCEVAPCVVSDLGPGPRQVQVMAPGYPPASVSEVVEPGKQRLALVSLGAAGEGAAPAPTAPAATTAAAIGGEVVANGASNVRAIVDGVDRGSLPLRLRDLPAGAHRVRFEGGERFESIERSVDVAAGRSVDLGTIKLRLLKGRARIEVADTGARVTIEQNGSEHLLRGPWPMTVEIDATRPARLLAHRRGYKDFELPITFEDGQAERTFRVELEPASSAGAAVAFRAARERPVPARQHPAPAEDKTERDEPAAAAPASGTGALNINSLPASRVLVDGTPIGSTPKVDYQVPAGTHTVTFVHPDLGKKSITVTVKPGGTAVAAVRFKQPESE